MKKNVLSTIVLLFLSTAVFCQKQYKVSQTTGLLKLSDISGVTIEGYNGSEIVFTLVGDTGKTKDDPRAAGLSLLGSTGFDNTNIGLNISSRGETTNVSLVDRNANRKLNVKVPFGVKIRVDNSRYSGDDSPTILRDISSEIEANSEAGGFRLENVTGPVSLRTKDGNIEATFSSPMNGPVSLYTMWGFIDVSIPADSKADLTVRSEDGNIYADKDLALTNKTAEEYAARVSRLDSAIKRAVPKVSSGAARSPYPGAIDTSVQNQLMDTERQLSQVMRQYHGMAIGISSRVGDRFGYGYFGRGSGFSGSLNGGGSKIALQSLYGKIYIRKK